MVLDEETEFLRSLVLKPKVKITRLLVQTGNLLLNKANVLPLLLFSIIAC